MIILIGNQKGSAGKSTL